MEYEQPTRLSADDLYRTFAETRALLEQMGRETDRRIQENERRIQETDRHIQENERRAQESERRFQETERLLKESRQESDRKMEETYQRLNAMFDRTDQELREAKALFVGQWGRLMEALVKPSAIRLFQERGLMVNQISERVLSRRGGEEMEIDLLLVDGDLLIAVEVKTTLRVEDVRKAQRDLERLPEFFPRYRGLHVYGAVASLHVEEEADRFAYRQGLFVLRMGRDGLIEMANDSAFRPRDYAAMTV